MAGMLMSNWQALGLQSNCFLVGIPKGGGAWNTQKQRPQKKLDRRVCMRRSFARRLKNSFLGFAHIGRIAHRFGAGAKMTLVVRHGWPSLAVFSHLDAGAFFKAV